MALQLSTGYGSLLAVSIGASDIATIYSLGRRVGNWWTATSGDADFLRLLDEDELNILKRRGVLDIARFNKTWNDSMALLANGKKTVIEGEQARKVLGDVSRFTACMVCIIAVLDTFADYTVTRRIFKDLLLRLLKATEHGEDLLFSQLSNRINAWRSAACVRGLHSCAREIRQSLLVQGKILPGLLPTKDAKEAVTFLFWLLAENNVQFRTSSTDLAGIALCLSATGFDLLSVHGFRGNAIETSCQLVYDTSRDLVLDVYGPVHEEDWFVNNSRGFSTTVSLTQPEESMGVFPIGKDVAHRCRYAWKRGSQAAKVVELRLLRGDRAQETEVIPDLNFVAVDLGGLYDRVNESIFKLADAHGFVLNKELFDGLQQVLETEPDGTADWLLEQTKYDLVLPGGDIPKSPVKGTTEQLNAFTIFQAFFMGYYYAILLRLVDTTALQLQIVDGAWGFRSLQFLVDMRARGVKAARSQEGILRQTLIELLSALLFSSHHRIENLGSGRHCIGIVGKRTILVSSLLNNCRTPDEMSQFVLLDVDVGGIPADRNGIIRSGVPEHPLPTKVIRDPIVTVTEIRPDEDCTRHIEADWDADPETALLCIRYKGRRVATLNVAQADRAFLFSYTRLVSDPSTTVTYPQQPVNRVTINDLVQGIIPDSTSGPVYIQAYAAPCLIYAFAAIYIGWPIAIESNCPQAAWAHAQIRKNGTVHFNSANVHLLVIASAVTQNKDIVCTMVEPKDRAEERMKPYEALMREQKLYPEHQARQSRAPSNGR